MYKIVKKTKYGWTNIARKLKVFNRRFSTENEEKLPKEYIGAYSSFVGSPISEGIFQFDLWKTRSRFYRMSSSETYLRNKPR